MWRRAATYGMLLAVGAFALQWLDYQRFARAHSGDIFVFLIAAAFLALGVLIGARVVGATRSEVFDGNAKARDALRISPTELSVLEEMAAGRSNKEITIKTHVSHLFDKLGAKRRTDAVNKARELGIVR
jgi:DNA-binding NarL/FixJ family response regulator